METTREDLIEAAERGRAVGRLVNNEHVKSVFDESLALVREQICMLDPTEQMAFTIGKASIEAIENFRNGLFAIVANGEEAERALTEFDEPKEKNTRGLL